MRTADDPNYVIDWEGFAVLDRNKLQMGEAQDAINEFDTTIHGPWMERWVITHHNKHTESMKGGGSSWHSHVKA
jgi:hypothetical protein